MLQGASIPFAIRRAIEKQATIARDSAETYTDSKYTSYSLFSASLGIKDTTIWISPDSTETCFVFIKTTGADTLVFQSTVPVKMDSLVTSGGTADTIFPGLIGMFSGDTSKIPSGWSLCDGVDTAFNGNDTFPEPDLRGRFIVGFSSNYAVNDTGGIDSTDFAHTHTVASENTHTHAISWGAGTDIQAYVSGSGYREPSPTDAGSTNDHGGATGSSQTYVDNRPRYYVLAYIMYLGN